MNEDRVGRPPFLVADVAGYSPLMGADEEGTFTTKIKEHRGRFVYTGSAGRSIAVPLASRWRHHNTATPATTTKGTTAICTMIQPAPDSIAPEANDDSATVPNTRKSLNA